MCPARKPEEGSTGLGLMSPSCPPLLTRAPGLHWLWVFCSSSLCLYPTPTSRKPSWSHRVIYSLTASDLTLDTSHHAQHLTLFIQRGCSYPGVLSGASLT